MTLGNIVSEDPEVKEYTIEQLKEKVENEDPGLMQKLRYYSKTLEVIQIHSITTTFCLKSFFVGK